MDTSIANPDDRSLKHYEWVSIICAVIIIACIVFGVTIAPPSLEIPLLVLTNLTLAGYIIFGRFVEGSNPKLLTRYAESAYFVGYFATILGLLALAFSITTKLSAASGKLSTLEFVMILEKGASAVISTVVGLVGMFILRVRVQTLEAKGEFDAEGQASLESSQGPFSPELTTKIQDTLDSIGERFIALEVRQLAIFDATFHKIEKLGACLEKLDETVQNTAINIDKRAVEVLDTSTNKIQELFVAIDNILRTFESKQTAALTSALEKVGDLGSSIAQLDGTLQSVVGNFELLKTSSTNAGAALADVAGNATTIKEAVESLNQITGELRPAWESIKADVEKVSGLHQRIDDLGQALDGIQVSFSACQGEVDSFTGICRRYKNELGEILTELEQRASQIGTLTLGVTQFIEVAVKIAPTLKIITDNLSKIADINTAVGQLQGNVQGLNTALTGTASAVTTISKESRELTQATGDLVTAVRNQLHHLLQLTQPFSDFANAMNDIKPSLADMTTNITAFGEFGKQLDGVKKQFGGVQEVMGTLQQATGQSEVQIQKLKTVMVQFFNLVRAEEEARRKSGYGLNR